MCTVDIGSPDIDFACTEAGAGLPIYRDASAIAPKAQGCVRTSVARAQQENPDRANTGPAKWLLAFGLPVRPGSVL